MRWDKRYGYGPRVEIPKAKAADLRRKVKLLTGSSTTQVSLGKKLQEINPILRGWANYYRYCTFAGRVYSSLDWYISGRLWRWLRKKRPKASAGDILGAYQPSSRRRTRRLWREGSTEHSSSKCDVSGIFSTGLCVLGWFRAGVNESRLMAAVRPRRRWT